MKKGELGRVRDPKAKKRVITWSMQDKWLRCRRMFYYRYIAGVDSDRSMPLLFGSLIHNLMESELQLNKMYQSSSNEILKDEIIQRETNIEHYIQLRLFDFQKVAFEWKTELLQMLTTEMPEFAENDIIEHEKLALGMMENWLRLYGASDLRNYRVIAVEPAFFDVSIMRPNGKLMHKWKRAGRVDAVLQNVHSGRYFIREIKTTSASDARALEKRTILDPQIRNYADAISRSKLLPNGERIDEVQYVAMRKKLPSYPARIKCVGCKGSGDPRKTDERDGLGFCGKCKGSGTQISKSKSVDSVREVVEKFLDDCGESLCEYQSMLDNLSGWERFINVSTHFLSQDDIDEANIETFAVAQDIDKSLKQLAKSGHDCLESMVRLFPRNTSQCSSPTGFCSYRDACSQRMTAYALSNSGMMTPKSDSPELEDVLGEYRSGE